jgi:hypothetical protein
MNDKLLFVELFSPEQLVHQRLDISINESYRDERTALPENHHNFMT